MKTPTLRVIAVAAIVAAGVLALPSIANAGETSARTPQQTKSAPSLARRILGKTTWNEAALTIDSPKAAMVAVSRRVKYRSEDQDQWTSGPETWERGYGDCEDIAACTASLCREKGIEAWVQVFMSSKTYAGHAIAMGRWEGKLWIANNDRFEFVGSVEEATRKIARSLGWRVEDTTTERIKVS